MPGNDTRDRRLWGGSPPPPPPHVEGDMAEVRGRRDIHLRECLTRLGIDVLRSREED